MLEEQSLVKERIRKIEEILYNAEVIDPNDEKSARVTFGSTVTFMVMPHGDKETYTIVGEIHGEPTEGKISSHSPIGRSLLGSKTNEEILVEIPSGKIKIRVLEIE